MPNQRAQAKSPRPSTGRRRNDRAHRCILDTTLELLETAGYHDLTIEAVAARAGVSKATIYRWWRSKSALVAEAIATRLDQGRVPITGDPRADLRASIQVTIDNYGGSVGGIALPALLADLVFDQDGYNAFRENFLVPRREASAAAIRRVIETGLLPADTDVELLLDVWAGAIFYRILISRQPISPGLADDLLRIILGER
jgi:AcrR family transcriptional regulator